MIAILVILYILGIWVTAFAFHESDALKDWPDFDTFTAILFWPIFVVFSLIVGSVYLLLVKSKGE